jgi:outer membrane protein
VRGQGSYTRLGGNLGELELELPGIDSPLLAIERDRFHTEISLEHALFTSRLRHEIQAATHQAQAAGLQARQEEAAVAFGARRAYWGLFQARALGEAVEASLALVDEHLAQVQRRLEAGTALTSELLAAQTRRSEVLLERVEVANAARVAQLELNRSVGLPLDTEVYPVGLASGEAPESGTEAGAPAPPASPRLLALEEQARALAAQVGAVRGGWLPELAFVGRYLYARPSPYSLLDQDRFRATWEVGLAAHWRLWNGGRRAAELARSGARLEAAEARLAEARDELAVEVARQRLEVRRANEAVAVAAEVVRTAEESLRVARLQFQEGVVLSAQVLEAEQAHRAARVRQARALAERELADAALLLALGRVE